MSSFGSLILPLAYAPAPWLYAHDVRRAAGYNPSGSGYTWDISYRFKARKIAPWNAFMNPQGTWQPVVSTQSGQPYWPSYDYNGLFPSTSNQPIS